MPHIHLETTADVHENADVPDILAALVAALSDCESVKPNSIKAYHTLRSVWVMGEGAREGFAHVTLSILTGRSMELKQTIADRILEVMKTHFSYSLENELLNVSVDLREMVSETYRKA